MLIIRMVVVVKFRAVGFWTIVLLIVEKSELRYGYRTLPPAILAIRYFRRGYMVANLPTALDLGRAMMICGLLKIRLLFIGTLDIGVNVLVGGVAAGLVAGEVAGLVSFAGDGGVAGLVVDDAGVVLLLLLYVVTILVMLTVLLVTTIACWAMILSGWLLAVPLTAFFSDARVSMSCDVVVLCVLVWCDGGECMS